MSERSNPETHREGSSLSHGSVPDLLPHPYQSLNAAGEIRAVNDAWTAALGYERSEVESEWFGSLLTAASADQFESLFPTLKSDGRLSDVALEVECADGQTRRVSYDTRAAYDDEGEFSHTHGQFVEVTGQTNRELQRYERLVENLPIGVYQNTPGSEGTFTLVNGAMVELFDADSKEQLLAWDVSDLYVDPEQREAFSDRLVEAGVVRGKELKLETLAGEEIWGEVTAIATETDGDLVFDGAIKDVTERKQYERELREQRDNLEVLNQVLRHDIRNDLQVVLAHADLLAEECEKPHREYVERIAESADQAVELTRTARDMSAVMLATERDRQEIELRTVLEGELDEIRDTYPDALVLLEGTIPDVTVMANDMLGSVFRNLLKNAIQHNDEAVPEVTLSATVEDGEVLVRVADNGPGVPDHRKEAIFGKGEKGLDSEGTGIGLYLVRTLVESYGGQVWVEDSDRAPQGDDEGAVFVVELPRGESSTDG